jgi:hypothetical protein
MLIVKMGSLEIADPATIDRKQAARSNLEAVQAASARSTEAELSQRREKTAPN